MENRTLKELYQILYDYIKNKPYIYGLCIEIKCLENNNLISHKEDTRLLKHFKSQKPKKGFLWGLLFSKHYSFAKNKYYDNKSSVHSYWWHDNEGDDLPGTMERKKFILHLISKL